DGEVMLFSPGYASPEQAAELLREAAGELERVAQDAEAIRDACRARDEALALLPALAAPLMNRPEPGVDPAWRDTVQILLDLVPVLAQGPASADGTATGLGRAVDSIQQKTAALRARLDALRKPFTEGVA